MNKKMLFAAACLSLLTLVAGCGGSGQQASKPAAPKEKKEIYVFAAASLTDAVNEIKKNYEAAHPDIVLQTHYAGSGTLMNQILEGAPVDVFISASDKQMDTLEQKDVIDKASRVELLQNELVLITPKDSKLAVSDFRDVVKPEVEKIAVANPGSVPVGQYSKGLFEKLGIWDQVSQRMVMSTDVRQSLDWVATGNVQIAPVYRTDAAIEKDKVKIVAVAPEGVNKAIFYPLAMIKKSAGKAEVKAFYDYLKSDDVKKVYEKYGFKVTK